MSSSSKRETIEAKLTECFESVFPTLEASEIRNADQSNVEGWDSIAALNLVNVIEEELEIQIDFEEVAELTSFAAIAGYLERVVPD